MTPLEAMAIVVIGGALVLFLLDSIDTHSVSRRVVRRLRRRKGIAVPLRPHQTVKTPPAVRRARAPQRQAMKAHRRGRRNFRR